MNVGLHMGVPEKVGGLGVLSGKLGQASLSYRPKKEIIARKDNSRPKRGLGPRDKVQLPMGPSNDSHVQKEVFEPSACEESVQKTVLPSVNLQERKRKIGDCLEGNGGNLLLKNSLEKSASDGGGLETGRKWATRLLANDPREVDLSDSNHLERSSVGDMEGDSPLTTISSSSMKTILVASEYRYGLNSSRCNNESTVVAEQPRRSS
jgi:hypothetical protein